MYIELKRRNKPYELNPYGNGEEPYEVAEG